MIYAVLAATALVTAVLLTLVFARVASLIRQPPYIALPAPAVEAALDALELKAGDVLVDLGCGNGQVLLAAYRRQPAATCLGFELGMWPLVEAWLRWRLAGRPANVRVTRQDFFAADVSAASKVFLYLFPWALDRLLPKLERELAPGTILVSADYQFAGKKPERVLEVGPGVRGLGRRISIYKF
jgi:SAM-dependent methyltransferase